MVEIILKDFFKAYEFGSISLRFFNVAGADSENEFGPKKASTHIISRILEKSFLKQVFVLNGDQYETKDGSCIRDYIHVNDLADGHVRALEYLTRETDNPILNLGTSNGMSVLEILEHSKNLSRTNFDVRFGSR